MSDILTELDPKLTRVVNSIVTPYLRDDVLQEVRIRVWQLSQEKPGEDITGLAMAVARRCARRVSMRALQGQSPWTGSPSQVGKVRGEVSLIHGDAVVTGDGDQEDTIWDYLGLELDDPALSEVELDLVLSKLSAEDQELVRLRYWDRLTNKQVAAILGTTEAAVEKRWAKRIKPLLTKELAC